MPMCVCLVAYWAVAHVAKLHSLLGLGMCHWDRFGQDGAVHQRLRSLVCGGVVVCYQRLACLCPLFCLPVIGFGGDLPVLSFHTCLHEVYVAT